MAILGKLVGTNFFPAVRSILLKLSTQPKVLLVREPFNQFDKNAVAVYIQAGYIDRGTAERLTNELDSQTSTLRVVANALYLVDKGCVEYTP